MIQDIQIFGARLHNLKNVHVTIPTGKISAICGPSGCGKSTLALDVLHAECQRRYLETLSPFIARIAGVRGAVPVDSISGLRPSIAFESWDTRRDGRASVGGLTECDHLLRGIWIRKATFTCPICAKVLDISTSQEMVERIALLPPGSRAQLMSPIIATSQTLEALAQTWIAQGFVRAYCDGNFLELSSIPASMAQSIPRQFSVVVDRWIIKEGIRSRIADSLAIALRIGQGSLWVHQQDGPQLYLSLSPRCPEHGAFMPELDAGMFSPYSLVGRCPQCEGNGKSESSEVCTQCHGSRLNEILRTTQCGGLSWQALVAFPIEDLHPRLQPIFADLPPVYQPAWRQVQERFVAMKKLGLGHLGLARGLDTLSDGELQRLRLVNLAGGHLNGLLFILDEPGSGLHPEDCERVWELLSEIRSRGNTLVMIEHQMAFLQKADYLIEMGPGAGEAGGEILRQGPRELVLSDSASPTRKWLEELNSPRPFRQEISFTSKLRFDINPFRNLQPMVVEFPVGAFSVVCGVSGSGKSSLIFDGIASCLRKDAPPHAWCTVVQGSGIEMVLEANRDRIRSSHRSTVATATGLMTPLRDLFASLFEARTRGFGTSHFSTNVVGGRCEACQGLGTIEDPAGYGDFTCHVCQGHRFRDDILAVRFKTLNISEILDLTVDAAFGIFAAFPGMSARLKPLRETGLGYIRLGQSTRHLSGGELQRVELAIELAKATLRPTLYLFDEPARGLHRDDIAHLLELFRKLTLQGHTIIAIEHQSSMVRDADWLVELHSGNLLFCGPLQKTKDDPHSRIAQWL